MNNKMVIPDTVKAPELRDKKLPKPVIKFSTGESFKHIRKKGENNGNKI